MNNSIYIRQHYCMLRTYIIIVMIILLCCCTLHVNVYCQDLELGVHILLLHSVLIELKVNFHDSVCSSTLLLKEMMDNAYNTYNMVRVN